MTKIRSGVFLFIIFFQLITPQQTIFNLINEKRAKEGLPLLTLDPILSVIAEHHSKEMAEYEKVSHISPVYGFDFKKRVGYTFPLLKPLGENVASGMGIHEVHLSLMESPGHRANILNPDFKRVGIGITKRGGFIFYVTEVFSGDIPKWMVPRKPRYYFEKQPPSEHAEVFIPSASEIFIFTQPEEEKLVAEGMDLYRLGKNKEAILKFKKAIKVNPEYIYAYYNLGLVYYNLGNYKAALSYFREVLKRKKDDIYSRYYLGATYYHSGEYRKAIAEFEALIDIDFERYPDVDKAEMTTGSLYFLALSFDQLPNKENAIHYYQTFLKKAKSNSRIYLYQIVYAERRIKELSK
jgi:tetratricopeptide (TPR) repeat protein